MVICIYSSVIRVSERVIYEYHQQCDRRFEEVKAEKGFVPAITIETEVIDSCDGDA